MISPSEVHANAKAHGFWDTERNFGECLMLVVSELGEAIEAHRRDETGQLVGLVIVVATIVVGFAVMMLACKYIFEPIMNCVDSL